MFTRERGKAEKVCGNKGDAIVDFVIDIRLGIRCPLFP